MCGRSCQITRPPWYHGQAGLGGEYGLQTVADGCRGFRKKGQRVPQPHAFRLGQRLKNVSQRFLFCAGRRSNSCVASLFSHGANSQCNLVSPLRRLLSSGTMRWRWGGGGRPASCPFAVSGTGRCVRAILPASRQSSGRHASPRTTPGRRVWPHPPLPRPKYECSAFHRPLGSHRRPLKRLQWRTGKGRGAVEGCRIVEGVEDCNPLPTRPWYRALSGCVRDCGTS